MSALQQHEIRRYSDGSIDISHYALAARRLRREAIGLMARRLLRLGRTMRRATRVPGELKQLDSTGTR